MTTLGTRVIANLSLPRTRMSGTPRSWSLREITEVVLNAVTPASCELVLVGVPVSVACVRFGCQFMGYDSVRYCLFELRMAILRSRLRAILAMRIMVLNC